MIVDVHGYNTRSSENMNLYVPKYTKEICKRMHILNPKAYISFSSVYMIW